MTQTSFSPSTTLDTASDILGDTSALDNSVGQSITGGTNQEIIVEPVYTIPKNSTLIGSTSMTALMGRVPINGSVEDPYPVKIIVGNENLTANGLELPEVSHMIFSGTATGDWTLSCVRADLTSVTYVFEDGTIQTSRIAMAQEMLIDLHGFQITVVFPVSQEKEYQMQVPFLQVQSLLKVLKQGLKLSQTLKLHA